MLKMREQPIKHPYTTFTHQVVCIITHKTAYRKAIAMRVLDHNSSILGYLQF